MVRKRPQTFPPQAPPPPAEKRRRVQGESDSAVMNNMTITIAQSSSDALGVLHGITTEGHFDRQGRKRLTFFVDGSIQMHHDGELSTTMIPNGEPRPGGYGVVCRLSIPGNYGSSAEAFAVKKAYTIVQVKKMGVAEALAAAIREVEATVGSDLDNYLVRVFIDSQETLEDMKRGVGDREYTGCFGRDTTRPIDIKIIGLAGRLHDRGCAVELHWMPRGATEEHKLADTLSRMARVGEYRGSDVELTERRPETAGLDEEVEKAVEKFLKQRG